MAPVLGFTAVLASLTSKLGIHAQSLTGEKVMSIFWDAPEFPSLHLPNKERSAFQSDEVSHGNSMVYEDTGTPKLARGDIRGMARTVLFA
jgi:hypothetical protein